MSGSFYKLCKKKNKLDWGYFSSLDDSLFLTDLHETTSFCNEAVSVFLSRLRHPILENSEEQEIKNLLYCIGIAIKSLKKIDGELPTYELEDCVEFSLSSLYEKNYQDLPGRYQYTLKIIGNFLSCTDHLQYFPAFDPHNPEEVACVLLFEGMLKNLDTIVSAICCSDFPQKNSELCLQASKNFHQKLVRFGRVMFASYYAQDSHKGYINSYGMEPYEGVHQSLSSMISKLYQHLH